MEVIPTENFQPDVVLMGLRIGEPVIALTSIFVALVCFSAWIRLGKLELKNDAHRLSRIFFLLMGISTMIGGLVGHAFLYTFPFAYKLPGWALGMVAVSALEQASTVRARAFLGESAAKTIMYLNIVELTLALWFVSATLWFPVVEIHSGFGFLLVVAPLEIMIWRKTRSQGSREILWGILLLIAAVMMHILKISFGVWFSFFDFAHLLMCVAFWKIMLGTEADSARHLTFSYTTVTGREGH